MTTLGGLKRKSTWASVIATLVAALAWPAAVFAAVDDFEPPVLADWTVTPNDDTVETGQQANTFTVTATSPTPPAPTCPPWPSGPPTPRAPPATRAAP